MSLLGVSGAPWICSGDMNPGVPMIDWVAAVPSVARAIPKSMTRGPSSASSTLPGLRSRWISPTRWISVSASARLAASTRRLGSGSGPWSRTAWSSGSDGT